MIKSIDNLGLCVTDLPRAIAFYQKLGFEKKYENDRGVTMVAGPVKLFVFITRRQQPPAVAREFTLFQNPPGIDHVSFLVDDVDRTYAELTARGVVFSIPPADQDWGARIAALKDPDGNNIYF